MGCGVGDLPKQWVRWAGAVTQTMGTVTCWLPASQALPVGISTSAVCWSVAGLACGHAGFPWKDLETPTPPSFPSLCWECSVQA